VIAKPQMVFPEVGTERDHMQVVRARPGEWLPEITPVRQLRFVFRHVLVFDARELPYAILSIDERVHANHDIDDGLGPEAWNCRAPHVLDPRIPAQEDFLEKLRLPGE